MNTELSEIQRVLLEVFKSFDKFCKENDIKYVAAYGTLLGAIRHKGFIPWDDDVDVYMVREEYDKFIKLKDKCAATSKYRIADFHDKGYPYNFAKYYDGSKTFWEYRHFPFVIGPFVDVFILDNWDENNPDNDRFCGEYYKAYWDYRKSISKQSWKEIFSDIIHLNGLEGPIKLVKKLFYAPQYRRLLKNVEKMEIKAAGFSGPRYKTYSDLKSKSYKKEWFDELIEVPFEDTTILVPAKYDECLTMDYGDYMVPPAEHDRTGHHTAYYMNLDKALTMEEILREKSGELRERKKMSVAVIWDEIIHRKGF